MKEYINIAIDAVQTGKKIVVDNLVKNESISEQLNSIIDKQTEVVKDVLGVTEKMFKEMFNTTKGEAQ